MTEEAPSRRTVAAALTGSGKLPRIVASGYGEVAKEILALAFEHGVKVREDADLAEILAALDIGEDVPLEALHVVSELLARVYQANGRPLPTDAGDNTHAP